MAKIDTQFMTKTAKKPYPLEPHIHDEPEVLSNRKSALDPAEIMEFYSTFSAWRPAAYYIPL